MFPFIVVNMDASPIQSGSKTTGSDFSIDRILSDRKDRSEESLDVPEWLCCTRYHPPRLPRTASVCRSRRAGRHARVPFTAAQAAALEAAYARAPYLAPPALKALAAALQLRDDRIKIWFQNRRARERRDKSVRITPPQGVTLPPTTLPLCFPSNTWLPHNKTVTAHNTQAKMNLQRFGHSVNAQTPRPLASTITNSCLLSVQTFEFPLNCPENTKSNIVSDVDDDDRPGTPLDIETVED